MKVAILLALLLCSTNAVAQTTSYSLYDNFGITKMVIEADVEGLQRLSASEGKEHLAAEAGLYRSKFDIKKSSDVAKACIADPDLHKGAGLATLYLCYSILAGNDLMLGNVSGWASHMILARSIYNNNIKPGISNDSRPLDIASVDFEKFKSWNNSSVESGRGAISVPMDASHGVPLITATFINGADGKKRNVSSDFIVDTGASRSIISEETVKAIGLRLNDGFMHQRLGNDYSPMRLADPVDLEIGGITLKNVSFATSPLIKLNIIGLDLLYQLSPFKIEKNNIQFLAPPENSCKSPILLSSSLEGSYLSIRYPLVLGNERVLVKSDTGASTNLEASGVSLDKYPKTVVQKSRVITSMGMKDLEYVSGVIPVKLGEGEVQFATRITNQPSDVFPVSWLFGFAVQDTYDLFFDLQNGTGCFHERAR